MNAVWLRLFLIIEFLVAVPAVFAMWSQIGGQGHLDLMPWYWKLILGVVAGVSIVGFTAAIVAREKIWTLRSTVWMLLVLVACAGMALITYYYHLHEGTDESDAEQSTTAAVRPCQNETRYSLLRTPPAVTITGNELPGRLAGTATFT